MLVLALPSVPTANSEEVRGRFVLGIGKLSNRAGVDVLGNACIGGGWLRSGWVGEVGGTLS
jgi:hypothetical protein